MARETIRQIKTDYKQILKQIRADIKELYKAGQIEQIKELYGIINTLEKLRKSEYELYDQLTAREKIAFEIEFKKLEIESFKHDISKNNYEDDGFIEALEDSVNTIDYKDLGEIED